MAADDICPRCQSSPETVTHVLRDCDEVKEVWASILNPDYFSQFFSLGLEGWLTLNLSSKRVGNLHDGWQTLFGVMLYEL